MLNWKFLMRRNLVRRRTGSTLFEFAIVVPVLLALLFGIIEWGYIFAARTTIRNATVVAARAALPGATTNNVDIAGIQQIAKNAIMPLLPVTGSNPTVNVLTNAVLGDTTNAISVQMTYKLKVFIPWAKIGTTNNTMNVSATTVLR